MSKMRSFKSPKTKLGGAKVGGKSGSKKIKSGHGTAPGKTTRMIYGGKKGNAKGAKAGVGIR
jgi:hypothetical protein